jgi:hypothetical protein
MVVVCFGFSGYGLLANNFTDESCKKIQAAACTKEARAYGGHIWSCFTICPTTSQHEPHEQDQERQYRQQKTYRASFDG